SHVDKSMAYIARAMRHPVAHGKYSDSVMMARRAELAKQTTFETKF
ncbi:anaerobic sulfatase maturase, partial [Vibrio sp. 10N.222.55.E8]